MKKPTKDYLSFLSFELVKKLGNSKPTEKQISLAKFVLSHAPIMQNFIFNSQLTLREASCLYWAALGKTSVETANLLNIQPGTVEQHRQEAKKKLGCKSMAEAVFRGIQFGYLRPVFFRCEACGQEIS